MKNKLYYDKKEHIKTIMSPYSDDTLEKVPFSCDPKLSDEKLKSRISSAIVKRFKPRHYAGCGYSCHVHEFKRESPSSGYVILFHYQGIGD